MSHRRVKQHIQRNGTEPRSRAREEAEAKFGVLTQSTCSFTLYLSIGAEAKNTWGNIVAGKELSTLCIAVREHLFVKL